MRTATISTRTRSFFTCFNKGSKLLACHAIFLVHTHKYAGGEGLPVRAMFDNTGVNGPSWSHTHSTGARPFGYHLAHLCVDCRPALPS
jgi:hypothetical protein